ncbi:MAG: tetratricopeptide repeat protein [Desulfomonilia bacterium]
MTTTHVLIVVVLFVILIGVIWYVSRKALSQNPDAFEHIRTAAQSGDVYSQFKLAGMYYEGSGVPRDDAEAAQWYLKAAQQGHAEAQFIMGILYEKGDGVSRSDTEAYHWFSQAASQGHPRAEVMLEADKWNACKKDEEDETERREEQKPQPSHDSPSSDMLDTYLARAHQGDVDAQYNLGIMFYHGEGISRNYEEALKWFLLAAEQSDADAQYNLGFMYGRGEGVPKDYKKSVYWFKRAAEQGHVSAGEILEKMIKKP